MQWLRQRDRLATIVVTLIALVARVAFARLVPADPAWDGVLYERGGQSLARGLGYATFMFVHRSSDTVPTAFYPVGYPAFLGAVYSVFGASITVMRLAGCGVSALTVGFAHRLCLRFATTRASRIAALALAFMPGQVIFAESAMTEPLFGLLLTAAVFAFVHRDGAPGTTDALLTGILLAAATYVRPQAILVAPLLPFARRNAFREMPTSLRLAAVVTITAFALVVPWTARNCARLDGCAFVSTNGGSNLAIGAVPRANGRYFPLDANDGCRGVVGEVARDRCWRRVALDSIANSPRRWIQLAFVKLDHTLSYESFPIGYLREARAISVDDVHERTLRRAITGPWRLLVVFALLALLPIGARRRLTDAARVAILTFVVMLATHLLFFGGDRYHLPLVPLIAVLAAGAFRDLPARRRTSTRYALTHSREQRVLSIVE